MNRLLVIGSASSEVLHLEDRTVASVGGAGMYTAMAARRCGAQTAMFGPRPNCRSLRFPIGGKKPNISDRRLTLRGRFHPLCFQRTYQSMISFM